MPGKSVHYLTRSGRRLRMLRAHYVCSRCRQGPCRGYVCSACRPAARARQHRSYHRTGAYAWLVQYRRAKRALGLCIDYGCEAPVKRFWRCLKGRRADAAYKRQRRRRLKTAVMGGR